MKMKHGADLLKFGDGEFLEFDLDDETLDEVEQLAAEEKVTPFAMCVILMREELSAMSGEAEAGRWFLPDKRTRPPSSGRIQA